MKERVEFYEHNLGDAELASVERTIRSLFLTLGPRVGELERGFAGFLGCEHVIGVTSCSMALALSLEGLGIGSGDEVITTPMTFVATPNAALFVGATPVFADVERSTGLIDPAAVEAAITPRTKAIIAVHLYGQLADMRRLRAIADRHGLKLVEDAAHAIEAERDGVRVTELGDATAFSFYATKTITSGDGGAIAVHDPQLADRLRRLRNHGVTKDAVNRHGAPYAHWDMLSFGYKAAMTDVQAALLLPQLEHLHARRELREAIVNRYERALANHPKLQLVSRQGRSGHHLFTVQVAPEARDRVLASLGEQGIGAAVNYRSVHTLTYYRERFGLRRDDLPNAAAIGEQTISLPLWPRMSEAQVGRVVEALAVAVADAPAVRR